MGDRETLKAFDYISEGIQIISFDWRYLYVNDSVCKQGKSSREDLLGKTMMQKYPGIENAPMFKTLELCMADRTPRHLENEFRFPDNSIGYFDLSIQPVPEGILILSVDITERKRVADEAKIENENLEKKIIEHAQQLEAVNKELEAFSYSVSHDLRAPLRIINGYAQILKEDYFKTLDEECRNNLEVIIMNVGRMGQLIDDLLAFARLGKQPIRRSLIDMNAITSFAIEELKSQRDHDKAELTIKPLVSTRGDDTMMKVVMINLIGNALKYSGKKDKPEIEIGCYNESSDVVYYVKDNGVGFDMEYYHKLFGVFQRLHGMKDFEGTGVGLALVQRIINKHHGKVWAEGKEDHGATFYFSLPALDN